MVVCPYCGKTATARSRDHVFPAFLGGRRRIACCGGLRNCNNTFGHTFEIGATKYLQALHVFISSWGLPLRSVSPTWVAAHFHEGRPYDLQIGDTGVRPVLSSSSPHITWDKDGEILSREFRTRPEAERFARCLITKGKAERVEIIDIPPPNINLKGLTIELQLGPDIKRLALKMCVAAATLIPGFSPEHVSIARDHLTGARSTGRMDIVTPAYDGFADLDSAREALSHVIYVHRVNGHLRGVVQFFGVVQLYTRLGAVYGWLPDAAMLGTLDPVTGNECFSVAPQFSLPEPPFSISVEECVSKLQQWASRFRAEAIARGALSPPDLRIKEINIEK